MSTTYIPGVCNIGPAEIKTRRLSGRVGVAATIILFAILLVADIPQAWRFLIFLPATLGAMGYLQAGLHFCVRFGTTGLFNVSSTLDKRESVEGAEFRRKDQRKAIIIAAGSVLIGAAVAVLVFILP
jgi:hypothetical protein